MKEGLIVLIIVLKVQIDWFLPLSKDVTVLTFAKRVLIRTEEARDFTVLVEEDMLVLAEQEDLALLLSALAEEQGPQSPSDLVLTGTEDLIARAGIGDPIALVGTGDHTARTETGIEGPEVLTGDPTALFVEDLVLHMIHVTGTFQTPPYLMLTLLGKCLPLHSTLNINNFHH